MHRYFVVLKRNWVVIKLLFILVVLVFLFFEKNKCTITDLGEMKVNGHMFFVKKYVPVVKDEQELSKSEVFIIIKRGKLGRRGGVFGEFIGEKRGNSIIYVVSLLDDERDNSDSLIDTIYQLVTNEHSLIDTIHQLITNELGVKNKYYVVYGKPSQPVKGDFSEVVEKYCEKYKNGYVLGNVLIKPRSFFESIKDIIFFWSRGNDEEYRLFER